MYSRACIITVVGLEQYKGMFLKHKGGGGIFSITIHILFSFVSDYRTPQKVTYACLVPETRCFSCGEDKDKKSMRLVHNVAMHRTYVSLVKECFFVQLPDDVSLRLCAPCLNRMQKVHTTYG